jgi:ABC-2 type transport system ATP-binding protein
MMKIERLSFGYRRKRLLFDGLDLDLGQGSIYGLLGKNGAGKTTLLKLMTGLLYSQQGEITYAGNSVSKRLPDVLKEIFLLPEELYLPEFTPKQFINLYSPFWDRFSREQMDRVMVEFEVDCEERLRHMSYGQQKKFLIAFALATNCSMILMDEPTNGLDIPSKSRFRKVVASMIDDQRSIMISTHQVRDLEHLIDPVIIIEEGKIIFQETIEDISNGLVFTHAQTGSVETDDALYTEPAFGGNHVVTANQTGEASSVDFEMLFNAVLYNKEGIVKQINTAKR